MHDMANIGSYVERMQLCNPRVLVQKVIGERIGDIAQLITFVFSRFLVVPFDPFKVTRFCFFEFRKHFECIVLEQSFPLLGSRCVIAQEEVSSLELPHIFASQIFYELMS